MNIRITRKMAVAVGVAVVVVGAAALTSVAQASQTGTTGSGWTPFVSNSQWMATHTKPMCATPVGPRGFHCLAVVRTDLVKPAATVATTPGGFGPTDLQSAYGLPSANAGTGHTVAVVEDYDQPNLESDLGVYRSQYGLPACTTANGCFRKVNDSGQASPLPAGDTGWGGETSLDVDMVSAICPNCNILVVETGGTGGSDFDKAENTAVSLGAQYLSNSFGGAETSNELNEDTAAFNHPGTVITASSGDNGYGLIYPAASQYVIAVGGTSLTRGGGTRGWTEQAWSGAGSGCSVYEAKPSWQTDSGCAQRSVADISAVGDPGTGVAFYDSYGSGGWGVAGGTSVGAPIVAAAYALASSIPSSPGSFLYSHTGNLNDVTSGSNGSCGTYLCNAGPGYDGPTGLGTPNGTGALGGGTSGGGGGTPSPTPTGGGGGGGGTCTAPAWDANKAYNGGAQVSYNGHLYTAKWWTLGDQPDLNTGDGKPWSDNGACSGSGGGGGGPTPTPTTGPTGGNPTPTPTGTGQYPAWQTGHAYATGDRVSYNGANYQCLQAHTSMAGWEPPNVPALWQPIS